MRLCRTLNESTKNRCQEKWDFPTRGKKFPTGGKIQGDWRRVKSCAKCLKSSLGEGVAY